MKRNKKVFVLSEFCVKTSGISQKTSKISMAKSLFVLIYSSKLFGIRRTPYHTSGLERAEERSIYEVRFLIPFSHVFIEALFVLNF